MPMIIDTTPIPIAQAPSSRAPLLLAINPKTIPAAPKRIGITNREMIDNANAKKPMPVPACAFPCACPLSIIIVSNLSKRDRSRDLSSRLLPFRSRIRPGFLPETGTAISFAVSSRLAVETAGAFFSETGITAIS